MNYKGAWWIPALLTFACALILLLGFLTPSASAEVFVYGSVPNYSAVVVPNNSYVMQGENISQGNVYDLRGVYGWSGQVGHWNNDNNAGIGQPDQIVTLTGKKTTFIDPVKFPVGRWWQWDGDYCPVDSASCSTGFGRGNAYVFYVVQGQEGGVRERTGVQTSYITILQNGSSIQIPVTYAQVETYYATPSPTSVPEGSGTIMVSPTETPIPPTYAGPVNPDVQDRNGITINGGVSGATVVTQKASGMIAVPALAVIAGLLVMRRKE